MVWIFNFWLWDQKKAKTEKEKEAYKGTDNCEFVIQIIQM